MSEQKVQEITRFLAANDRDTGFLEYLPEETVTQLAAGIEKTLAAEQQRLQDAIAEGTRNLPAGLGGVVRGILN